jgi:hypothetical protein
VEGSPEQATTLPQREINASTPVFLPAGAEFETYAAVCRLAQDTVIRDSLLFDGRVKVNWKLEFTALSMEEDMAAQMMSFAFTQQADDYAAIVWVSKGEDAEAISRVLNRREVSVRLRRIGTRGEGTEHRLARPYSTPVMRIIPYGHVALPLARHHCPREHGEHARGSTCS